MLAGIVAGLFVVVGAAVLVGPPGDPGPKGALAGMALPVEPAPATPDPTPEALRAWIHAGDRASVARALAASGVEGSEAQRRQRQLYGVFSEVHPAVIAFARDWAEDEPSTAAALTARGWSLHSLGWTFRGEGPARTVHPQAMEAFIAAHSKGLRLMQEAVRLEPALLAASDGIVKMSYTIGQSALIAPEVARIMEIVPNRFTLTLAGAGSAPNWGGSLNAMEQVCQTHAAKVTDRPGYDAEVCLVDGLMQSGAMTFDEIRKMSKSIAASDNPLILEWQNRDADIQGETAADKLAHLDRLKAERPLSYLEANIYDQMSAQLAAITGEERPLEFPAAVARKAGNARDYADRNPGDWRGAERLLRARMEDRDVNGTKMDHDEFRSRAVASLEINPFNAEAWNHIGITKLTAGGDEAAAILAAEPYFINAAVYSNHASEQLKMLGGVKLALVFRTMANGAKPADPQRWQEGILCPMVRQLRLMEAVCQAEGKAFSDCAGLPWDAAAVRAQIAELTSAGLCQTEAETPLERLAYSPVQVSLR